MKELICRFIGHTFKGETHCLICGVINPNYEMLERWRKDIINCFKEGFNESL